MVNEIQMKFEWNLNEKWPLNNGTFQKHRRNLITFHVINESISESYAQIPHSVTIPDDIIWWRIFYEIAQVFWILPRDSPKILFIYY